MSDHADDALEDCMDDEDGREQYRIGNMGLDEVLDRGIIDERGFEDHHSNGRIREKNFPEFKSERPTMSFFNNLPTSAPGGSMGSIDPPLTWNSRFTFGKKHPGKTLKEVLEEDAAYLDWILGLKDISDKKLYSFLSQPLNVRMIHDELDRQESQKEEFKPGNSQPDNW